MNELENIIYVDDMEVLGPGLGLMPAPGISTIIPPPIHLYNSDPGEGTISNIFYKAIFLHSV